MAVDLEQLEDMAGVQLRKVERPSLEDVEKIVNMLRTLPMFNVDDASALQVIRRLEARHQITMSVGNVLEETDWKKWVSGKRAQIDFYYWNRYRKYLVDRKLSNQVITSVDQVTDKILDQLQDPTTEGSWDRRGLVMGHVQSGKTSNYIGLINKAADAGYKVIIVIAGTTNILRKQTQNRIDEGFSGRASTAGSAKYGSKPTGVGQYGQERAPVLYTNSNKDFNTQTAGLAHSLDSFKHPSVFVIKKNASTLKSLTTWLRAYTAKGQQSFIDLPMLIIDDEADNASINTKASSNEMTRINAQLRELLKLFTRSSYVGYSATPFANIFIDPDASDDMVADDLFPRNFIVSLDPPTNYFGPEVVFGDNSDQYVRAIDDHDSSIPIPHKKELQVVDLPESLKDAIRTFIVGRAIRIQRGQEHRHSSMMVNASVFTDVQTRLAGLIHQFLTEQRDAIKMYSSMPVHQATKYSALARLQHVFDEEFSSQEISWGVVQSLLYRAVAPMDVIQVNSRSNGALDYDDYKDTGRHVIAVGGYSLSRGVTLEGLQVSYFLRNSMAYDTLMQMGRWFGYRDEYEDLCRVWMPTYAADWYTHIAESIDILRSELKRMEQANATPKEFGLRVRAHPDTLIITARNKMGRSTKVPFQIGLAETLIETVTLKSDPSVNQRNLQVVAGVVSRIRDQGVQFLASPTAPYGWMAKEVPWNLIADFVAAFEAHSAWVYSDTSLVRDYIESNATLLPEWDVYVPSLTKPYSQAGASGQLSGLPIYFQQRTRNSKDPADRMRLSTRGRLASRGAESAGLTEGAKQAARDLFLHDKNGQSSGEIPDKYYRRMRTRPLLMLHLIYLTGESLDSPVLAEPVAAWSMSFPPSEVPQQTVNYFANATFIQEQLSFNDLGEDEELVDELL